MKAPNIPRRREGLLPAFLIGFAAMMITLIPYMLLERGNFIYYGDFNAQQIPFYNLLNDSLKSRWLTKLRKIVFLFYHLFIMKKYNPPF